MTALLSLSGFLAAQEATPLTIPGLQSPGTGLPVKVADRESPWAFNLATGWDSRYVSEGIDNLDGGGIWTAEGVVEYDAEIALFYLGSWYALGYDSDYDEVNVFAGFNKRFGDFIFDFGYTYLNFPELDFHDNEIGAVMEYGGLGFATVGVEWYYSFEAEGCFVNLLGCREFEVTDRFVLVPNAHLGINADYIAEGHEGFNHLFLGLGAEYALTERVSMHAHCGYNFAIDRDAAEFADDELLTDFFHGGVGIGVSF